MLINLKDKRILSFLVYQTLISMILVIICTMISSFLTYDLLQTRISKWSIDINNKLTKNYNDVFISSIVVSSENIYDQILRAQYGNDSNLSNVRYFLKNPVEANLLGIRDVTNYFISIAQANPLIKEVGIFYVSNHLIASNETVKFDYFYDFYESDIDYFLEKEEEIKRNGEINSINGFSTKNSILIMRPIIVANKVNALMFIDYSTEAFNKKLEEAIPDEIGKLLVLNKQGVVIYDNNNENVGEHYKQLDIYNEEMDDNDEGYYFLKDGKSVISILSYMTDERGWKYISVITEQFYLEPVQYLLKNLFICAIVSLLTGLLFTIIMSLWQSRSMNKIVQLCNETGKPVSSTLQIRDAYGFIRSTLTGLIKKVESQTEEINKLMPILRDNFAAWFMSTKPSDASEVNDTMLLMRVRFPFEKYVIIAVKAVYNIENATLEDDEYEPGYAMAEARLVLEREFNSNDSIGVFSQNSNYLAGLVNFDYSKKTFETKCKVLFSKTFHGFRFYISSGEVTTDLVKLTGTANFTIESLRSSYLYPETGYYPYDYSKKSSEEKEPDVLDNLSGFSEAIRHKDAKRASDYLYTLTDQLKKGGSSIRYAQKIMLEISSIIEKSGHSDELSKELILAFQGCNDIISLRKTLIDIIIEEFSSKTDTSGNSVMLVNEAKKYIDQNLTDTQLSLQMISERLNVTVQYMSQIFHNTAGMRFTEYIANEKMKLACKLLEDTSLNIINISEKIGYSSPQYFIRRFRMHFGITPSAYREKMK